MGDLDWTSARERLEFNVKAFPNDHLAQDIGKALARIAALELALNGLESPSYPFVDLALHRSQLEKADRLAADVVDVHGEPIGDEDGCPLCISVKAYLEARK